jgi:hypothetical protein
MMFDAPSHEELTNTSVDPLLAQDAVGERRIFRVDCIVPESDAPLVILHGLSLGARTQGDAKENEP